MKWTKTNKGVENERFAIERIIMTDAFSYKKSVCGYRLIDKQTGDVTAHGRMKDAKYWAEEWILGEEK